MPARKYTDEQLDKAAEMRERGLSHAQIGKALGMSRGCVSWHCLRLGADSPKTCNSPFTDNRPMVMRRNGHVLQRFTEDEDRQLLKLEASGISIAQISRSLGRKPNSVKGRLMTLARRESRSEKVGTHSNGPHTARAHHCTSAN